jgi:dTDP-4-amino-4,6-dideoxygalactose transaminase
MKALMQLAKQHRLLVVEDAAQAHMASIDGIPVGTFGDAAAFSFYPTKNMTSGEGGMIVFSDTSLARSARILRNQGMEKRYENEVVGFNLRMTDIHASIGRVQLKKLSLNTEKRRSNAELLSNLLKDSVEVPYIPDGYVHVFHQYTLKVPNHRNLLELELKKRGIGSGVYYPYPIHKLRPFMSDLELQVTSRLCNEVISLPVHQSLNKNQVIRIATEVQDIFKSFEIGKLSET